MVALIGVIIGAAIFLITSFVDPPNTPYAALIGFLVATPCVVIQARIGKQHEKKCPYCLENIDKKAKVCKHCGRDVPSEQEDGRE